MKAEQFKCGGEIGVDREGLARAESSADRRPREIRREIEERRSAGEVVAPEVQLL